MRILSSYVIKVNDMGDFEEKNKNYVGILTINETKGRILENNTKYIKDLHFLSQLCEDN